MCSWQLWLTCDVFMAVSVSIFITPCSLSVSTNTTEAHTASTFRNEGTHVAGSGEKINDHTILARKSWRETDLGYRR
jgi:hypothetical protein